MNSKIEKAASELNKSVGAYVVQQLINAQRNKQVELTEEQLMSVSSLIVQLTNAGYHQNFKTFKESVEKALA